MWITMKEGSVIFVIIMAEFAAGNLSPGLRVKFILDGKAGLTHVFKVPQTLVEAEEAGWSITSRPPGPLAELIMYCPPDKVVCVLMDDTGFIAGLQIAISTDKVTNNILDWYKRGFTSWTTDIEGKSVQFWTIQQYFVCKETFQKSRQDRIASRDYTRTLQEGAVWFTGIGHQLLKITTSEEDLKKSIFKLQSFMPSMDSSHYFYNMSTTTECTAEQLYPWFVMAFHGEVLATGFMTFTEMKLEDGERDWFEHPDRATKKEIVPHGPACLYELPILTMHIYFVDDPNYLLGLPEKA